MIVSLTLHRNSVDEPFNLRFGLSVHATGQDSGFVRREDQVPRSTDPVRSRCRLLKTMGCIRMNRFTIVRSDCNPDQQQRTFDGNVDGVVSASEPV